MTSLRILFLHPNLGLGGAERFILDAALALQRSGHEVWIYTTHYDPSRSFGEARELSERIRVAGSALPKSLVGRLKAPLAIAAVSYAALAARRALGPVDLVLVDLVSAVVPVVRRLGLGPVLFYGHYPDLLLSRHESWRSWYRAPLDRLEARGLRASQRVLVNSHFTLDAFRRAFSDLTLSSEDVLYPAVRENLYSRIAGLSDHPRRFRVLSLGRFVEHKNHPLVLEAFIKLYERVPEDRRDELELTIAGACDAGDLEQMGIKAQLEARAMAVGLGQRIEILTNVDDQEKLECLRRANVMAFPAFEEHFGLVPLEAMAAGRPVVAASQGGPTETIIDGENGRLVAPDAEAFAGALHELFEGPTRAAEMGRAGRRAVYDRFGYAAFTRRLDAEVRRVAAR